MKRTHALELEVTTSIAAILLTVCCNQIDAASQTEAGSREEVELSMAELSASHARDRAAPRKPRVARMQSIRNVQVGPRPYYLVDQMADGRLKNELSLCSEGPFHSTDFSIGHRGAPLQFPEETRESLEAAARMGAGILECDVTFTKDRQLVCRHSQCDLHTTTNILAVPELAAKCTQPFVPADPSKGTEASALCCTSDITLGEFKSLCGKMDGANPKATTVAEYLDGTSSFRTDAYSASCGTVLSHKEFIQLGQQLGAKFTPELKAPAVTMPFQGEYSQSQYAQQMIDEYKAARVPARHVFAQSFDLDDVLYWLQSEPEFGRQAVYLDDEVDVPGGYDAAVDRLSEVAARGVRIVAPPTWALVTLDAANRIAPSTYAKSAKAAGLDIITWTLERSGPLSTTGRTNYYYQSISNAIRSEGDVFVLLDVLAKQVGVRGVFSDWPGTVTYYANCMNF